MNEEELNGTGVNFIKSGLCVACQNLRLYSTAMIMKLFHCTYSFYQFEKHITTTSIFDVFSAFSFFLLQNELARFSGGRGEGGFMPSREGGCSTGIFESLIICSLWNRVVKLMTKWHRASTGGVSGGPKSYLRGFNRKNW